MKTHLYTLCWNEADMLGFFFRHYDSWVDRYFIYDDGSTDGSLEILKAHPKVELRQWNRKYPESYNMSQIEWMNEIWKESRGNSDWVVIVDIDEHLFVPKCSMKNVLEGYKSEGITLVPALGFQILSEEFPHTDEVLVETRTWGTPWQMMCKPSIFDPNAIDETNFSVGRHTSNSVGRTKFPRRDELFLFHYKYLGFERTLEKQNSQYPQLGNYDVSMGLVPQYAWSRKELCDFWNETFGSSKDLSKPNNSPAKYPYIYRWWRFASRWINRGKRFLRKPFFLITRLKILFTKYKYFPPAENFGQSHEKINQSPVKKSIYNLMINGTGNGKVGETIVITNEEMNNGLLIQCQRSLDGETMQDEKGILEILTAKEKHENKYQKNFDTFVITNSKDFAEEAKNTADKNEVKLVHREKLIEFISQLDVS